MEEVVSKEYNFKMYEKNDLQERWIDCRDTSYCY